MGLIIVSRYVRSSELRDFAMRKVTNWQSKNGLENNLTCWTEIKYLHSADILIHLGKYIFMWHVQLLKLEKSLIFYTHQNNTSQLQYLIDIL